MEVFSVNVRYEGMRPSDGYMAYNLYKTIDGAIAGLKSERDSILNNHPWLKHEIETDEKDHFLAFDDSESFEIDITKETVHE